MGSLEQPSGSTTLADELPHTGQLQVFSGTDVGLKRSENQDCVSSAIDPDNSRGCLIAVADGMGGHVNGEQASSDTISRIRALHLAGKLGDVEAIRKAFDDIDAQLHETLYGGGTTLVIAVVADSTLTVANIGDSRAYLFRDGSLRQITTDDSWVQSQVESGHLTAAQARAHPRRNVLLKALGRGRKEGAAVHSMRFLPGDMVLLCSDGLHGVVEDAEIAQVLESTETLPAACGELIRLALNAGGPDNVSVALCQLRGAEQS